MFSGKLYILNVEDEDEKDKRPYACNAYSRRLLLLNQGELTILEVEKGKFRKRAKYDKNKLYVKKRNKTKSESNKQSASKALVVRAESSVLAWS